MDTLIVNIFIQARMSSQRFPGKVLAPLHNKPILKHVIEHAKKAKNANNVIVLTSNEESDDPIAAYLDSIHFAYYRGSLNNVFHRFQFALKLFPCDYFVRISADSPFLNSALLEKMIQYSQENNYDIISNVVERTFPKGHSVEIAKSKIFLSVNQDRLSSEEMEHVFPFFYKHMTDYKIYSIRQDKNESHLNDCVDTLDDLQRLHSAQSHYTFCRDRIC